MIQTASRVWRGRWGVLRLAIAGAILWVLAADTPARLARLQLAMLPAADIAGEVRALRQRGRFAEAIVIADAGIAGEHDERRRGEIERERAQAQYEQQSMLRRLKDLARGAITGGGASSAEDGPDTSLELLLGAVATDLLVVGDIRDLIIQTGRWARGEKTDPVIVALSGVGIATTAAPMADWAPSVLKAARRSGAMSARMAELMVGAARAKNFDVMRAVMRDAGAIARTASPAGAMRLFRHVDTAEDAARLAKFLERTGPAGARALHIGGAPAVQMARSVESLRAAGKLDDAMAVEKIMLAAAGKGRAGAAWMTRGLHRPLLRPHPLIGLVKSVWKGNAQALIARAIASMDPYSLWALPAAAAWAFLELGLLIRRWFPPPVRRGIAIARARTA